VIKEAKLYLEVPLLQGAAMSSSGFTGLESFTSDLWGAKGKHTLATFLIYVFLGKSKSSLGGGGSIKKIQVKLEERISFI
jgi:hypothetical protein